MKKSAFIDEVEITVVGGSGGNGVVSFLREKSRPDGGPNGGNGGSGGAVHAVATRAVNTLLAFKYRKRIAAANGQGGMSKSKHGANGADTTIQVPLGTRIVDADTQFVHADLTEEGQSVLLAAGGHGGLGNEYFKSSTHRAPRMATSGQAGETRRFCFELKLLADVGLLGAPNAGKSTFLRAVSTAHPKTASYPFTTLEPNLGVLSLVEDDTRDAPLLIADIPGLIRGAADGVGLGNRFLRHLSRTSLLCHIVDVSDDEMVETCRAINDELAKAADSELAKKPQWLILNKSDLCTEGELTAREKTMRDEFPFFERVFAISALNGDNTHAVARALIERGAKSSEATQATKQTESVTHHVR